MDEKEVEQRIADAVAAERERCAQIAEQAWRDVSRELRSSVDRTERDKYRAQANLAGHLASRIRARSKGEVSK